MHSSGIIIARSFALYLSCSLARVLLPTPLSLAVLVEKSDQLQPQPATDSLVAFSVRVGYVSR